MSDAFTLQPTLLATAFERILGAPLSSTRLSLQSFQGVIAKYHETYKEWVGAEGRRRLLLSTWKADDIGQGNILEATISAIELFDSAEYRNNFVQWDRRFGATRMSHAKLLEAQGDREQKRRIEGLLFQHFQGHATPEESFENLAQALGKRYDLLAYLRETSWTSRQRCRATPLLSLLLSAPTRRESTRFVAQPSPKRVFTARAIWFGSRRRPLMPVSHRIKAAAGDPEPCLSATTSGKSARSLNV